MAFAAQSATGVPRLQRRNLSLICKQAWPRGRALRGFSHTALLLLMMLLGHVSSTHAQSAARFPDAPPAASVSAAQAATPNRAPRASATPASAPTAPTPAAPPTSTSAGGSWSRNLALTHFERAEELEQRGDIARALSEYTASLAIDSTLGVAYLRLGSLRERMGDAREAELVYSEAVRLGDTRARALLLRSRLYRAAGQGALALRDLEAAVQLEADRPALEELAQHYVEAHAFSAALFTFRRILASAAQDGDSAALESARLEVRALRVLAAEADPTTEPAKKHDWVGRSLVSIASR
jgi:tetratricopeptide (TPR) repeat protein